MLFKCKKCHYELNIPDLYIGKKFKCLKCNKFDFTDDRIIEKKEVVQQEVINPFERMVSIYKQMERNGFISREDSDRFFDYREMAYSLLPKSYWEGSEEENWYLNINKMSEQITIILAMHQPTSMGEIEKLAEMRKNGIITDIEFNVFSERFKLSTGKYAI